MQLIIEAISDKGSVRDHNEDMIMVGGDIFRDAKKEYEFDFDNTDNHLLIAVADGMGGHLGGEFASELVLNEMKVVIQNLPYNLIFNELKGLLETEILRIHRYLLDEGIQKPDRYGMGSTFTGVLFYSNAIFFINIGDSRLYRLRNNIIAQLSRDHSLKEMTGNAAMANNILANSFGGGEKIFFDMEDITKRILDNDILLLCSDGLNNELSDEDIENILTDPASAENLINQAKTNGGKDNISLIASKIQFG